MTDVSAIVSGWTSSEKAEALRLILGKFPVPQEVFEAYCGTTITAPMEFFIINAAMTRILLWRRPQSDPFFGGQWHFSGGLMLPGFAPGDVWPQLRTSKKYGLANVSFLNPIEIGVADVPKGPQAEGKCPRSQERPILHVVVHKAGDPAGDDWAWFPLDALPLEGPGRLLGHHQHHIRDTLMPWIATQNK